MLQIPRVYLLQKWGPMTAASPVRTLVTTGIHYTLGRLGGCKCACKHWPDVSKKKDVLEYSLRVCVCEAGQFLHLASVSTLDALLYKVGI